MLYYYFVLDSGNGLHDRQILSVSDVHGQALFFDLLHGPLVLVRV